MNRSLMVLLAATLLPLAPLPDARAEDATAEKQAKPDTPYYQGKVRFHLSGGYSRFGSNGVFTLSGGFGVFVVDNLEVGLDGAVWLGANPNRGQLGPQVRYILPVSDVVHPYLGAFYNRIFLGDGFADQDAVGARAGVLVRTSSVFLTIGLAYERVVSSCTRDCDAFYPEFGISLVL